MAIVTATITVDFTANYTGDHRVCWRIQGSGPAYDCNTLVNCVGGGAACQAIFTADINTTSCDGPIVFEGYVQAVCEDITSTGGRLPFDVTYIPTQTCFSYELTCDYVPLDTVTTDDNGNGLYLTGDTVVITRDPSDTRAVDATATCTVVGGIITINVTTPGEYDVVPTISIVSGTGTGAILTANLGTCSAIASLGTDCDKSDTVAVSGLPLATTYAFCTEDGLPVVPADYSVSLLGCCIADDTDNDLCFEHTIENLTVSPQNISHTICGGDFTTVAIPAGDTITVCTIVNGIQDPQDGTFTVVNTGVTCS